MALVKYPWALTKAVVAIDVSLSAVAGVGAVGLPVKVGEASVAYPCALTKAVVAMLVSLSAVAGVGAVGLPVKVGEAMFALRLSAVVTKAVVARAVVELPAVWVTAIVPVGRLGVPVKVGEARGAFSPRAVLRSVWSLKVPVIPPQLTEPPPPETVAHLSSVPSISLPSSSRSRPRR